MVNETRRETAPPRHRPRSRRWVAEAAYVLCVAAVAAWGFYTDSTATILLAVLLALPMGGPALVGYYVAYGLVAGVSGANPDVARSGGAVHAQRWLRVLHHGRAGGWFLHTMDVIGVLALAAAAVLNVILLRSTHRETSQSQRSHWPTWASDAPVARDSRAHADEPGSGGSVDERGHVVAVDLRRPPVTFRQIRGRPGDVDWRPHAFVL